MRLLSTKQSPHILVTADGRERKNFKYAILSHRWARSEDDGKVHEVTYEQLTEENLTEEQLHAEQLDVEQLDAEHSDPEQPRRGQRRENSYGWRKIFDACRIARERGIDYIWIDTCCIDKRSSAELTESLNSMYAWYGAAEECYAFLDGVPYSGPSQTPNDLSDDDSEKFRKSEWFLRGWTLQELLAPKTVRFYGKTNDTRGFIGTRYGLANHIKESTHIGRDYLRDKDDPLRLPVHSASVAQRMSWASKRDTLIPEDKTYSLLGIFGVNMPLLYGEGGEAAFKRLQLEIIARTTDDSIFAWGFGETGKTPSQGQGMLATKAASFENSGDITNDPQVDQATTQADLNAVVHVSMTPIRDQVLSYFIGPRRHNKDAIRLKCTRKPGKVSYTIWLSIKRDKDNKYYRTAITSYRVSGLRRIPVALQRFVTTPKQVSVSSRDPPIFNAAELEAAEPKHWWHKLPVWTMRLIDYVRLIVVLAIVIVGSTTGATCLPADGKGNCDTVILVVGLIFFFRDLTLNRVQFWAVLILWGLLTKLPSIGTESDPTPQGV